jgi:hydroxylaminobenzene mutase
VPLLTSLGLISLALGALSGWLVLAATEKGAWLREHGVPAPVRFRQAHLDWIMMGLILIAVQTVAPDMPGWIRGCIAFGTIVNPILFLPLAFAPAAKDHVLYKAVAIVSFTALSVGLPGLAIWAIATG